MHIKALGVEIWAKINDVHKGRQACYAGADESGKQNINNFHFMLQYLGTASRHVLTANVHVY